MLSSRFCFCSSKWFSQNVGAKTKSKKKKTRKTKNEKVKKNKTEQIKRTKRKEKSIEKRTQTKNSKKPVGNQLEKVEKEEKRRMSRQKKQKRGDAGGVKTIPGTFTLYDYACTICLMCVLQVSAIVVVWWEIYFPVIFMLVCMFGVLTSLD